MLANAARVGIIHLHLERAQPNQGFGSNSNTARSSGHLNQESAPKVLPISLASKSHSNSQIVLSTAQVIVRDSNGNPLKARVLLDAGSQSSFITTDFCNKLVVETTKIKLNVRGINNSISQVTSKTSIKLESRCYSFSMIVNCLVIPVITGDLPNQEIDPGALDIPSNIVLTNPEFAVPGKIDILLSVEYFWKIMNTGQINLSNYGPFLKKTVFG